MSDDRKLREEEYQLEELMLRAAEEPAYRPEFYQRLMEAGVYIIGNGPGGKEGESRISAGENISIEQWQSPEGGLVIPFFTSLVILQKAVQREVPYMRLPARDLFQITEGATLVINPMSEVAKEFTPVEIKELLDGNIPGGHAERMTVKQETQVMLGQPKNYPDKMVESLSTLMAKDPAVQKAYLAQIYNPSEKDAKPHLLIGIVMGSEAAFDALLKKAGPVASAHLPSGETVDFMIIEPGAKTGGEGVAGYLTKETKPFYEAGKNKVAGNRTKH